MAAKFSLVCLTCRIALPLGRVVTIKEDGSTVPLHFEGFRNHWDGRWVGRPELLECVQRFLAFHLGHELGTVDDDAIIDALEPFEIDQEPFRWVADAEELLDVDWEIPDIEDRFNWPAARQLAARLSRLASGS
jgi:hypothetical protein